jgi:hypothetical protein
VVQVALSTPTVCGSNAITRRNSSSQAGGTCAGPAGRRRPGTVGDPAFGLGGVLAEALGDVDAEELIASVTASRVLYGYRSDIPALRDLLLPVSQLVEDVPEIVEMDISMGGMDIIGVLMAC